MLKNLQNAILCDSKPQTRHVMSCVWVGLEESVTQASAQCYVFVFQALPDFPLQASFGGHYHDRFEKTDSGRRFVSRDISPDLLGDLSRHRAEMA